MLTSIIAQAPAPDFYANASNWTSTGAVLVILVYLITKAMPEKDKLHREAMKELCETHTETNEKLCGSLDALASSFKHDTGIILDEFRSTCEDQRKHDAEQRDLDRKSHSDTLERMAIRCDNKIDQCRETNHRLSNALQVHRVQPVKKEE